MIFLTVGTQCPFNRLVKIVDSWAENKKTKIFAQIGNSDYKVKNFKYSRFLTKEEFDKIFNEAELIISHAGMGTIISSMEQEKKIIVFPRKAEYHEHRNDHQLAITKVFENSTINIAYNNKELVNLLNNANNLLKCSKIGKFASITLLETIAAFIDVN